MFLVVTEWRLRSKPIWMILLTFIHISWLLSSRLSTLHFWIMFPQSREAVADTLIHRWNGKIINPKLDDNQSLAGAWDGVKSFEYSKITKSLKHHEKSFLWDLRPLFRMVFSLYTLNMRSLLMLLRSPLPESGQKEMIGLWGNIRWKWSKN